MPELSKKDQARIKEIKSEMRRNKLMPMNRPYLNDLMNVINKQKLALEKAIEQRDSYAADNAFLYGSDTYDVAEENQELQKILEVE